MYRFTQENSCWNGIPVLSSSAIDEANRLVLDLEYKSNQINTLLELAKENKVKTIKNNICYGIWFNNNIIHRASRYLRNSKLSAKKYEETLKIKKKEDQQYLLSLTSAVKNILDYDGIEIFNITFGGYEEYYYELAFTLDGIRYSLQVPNVSVLNEENMMYTNEGKLLIGDYTDHRRNYFEASYVEDEIKEAFRSHHMAKLLEEQSDNKDQENK